ncbi:hypothetical protein AA0472_2553 [Acetobacter estunensis NRIC 0472]|uniref:Yip1 domain-containing protein n=1 Tax=Acetobacter estunensis TaxID=104097 RepID=A0A967EI28_9PROT|nr:hypothetical protein [Acetobacter estunensis]NHO54757.1 hypothetical protein [Acetobacter estunensis]GBQ27963.1 hypothetical protein AA0472_2553 [Acetobacter estunensis NRIC 0472]
MEGLVNLTNDLAQAGGWLLPTLCYFAAMSSFIGALWGFYRYATPDLNPNRTRPWVPWVLMVMTGVFISFNVILSKSLVSAGSDIRTTLSDQATSYDSTAGDLLSGTGPKDAIIVIVQDFAAFFQIFGAFACFFAVVTWVGVVKGRSQRGFLSCAIQYVFGVILMNPVQEANWLLSYWP